ncbi:MAG TPA: hypothetical protein VH369_19075 [Bryobacteraceae bacterium]|jgi:hypothetical protein
MKNAITKKINRKKSVGMRDEYDFSTGVRGKYAEQYRSGTNVVFLEPQLAEAFPDSKSVNNALKALLTISTGIENRKRS